MGGYTVNEKNAFYSRRSCKEISDGWGKHAHPSSPVSGNYYITTYVKNGEDDGEFKRQMVRCIFHTEGAVTKSYTVLERTGCDEPIIPFPQIQPPSDGNTCR